MHPLPSILSASPVRVLFAPGALEKLGPIAADEGATRVLLVTDPGIVRAGHVQRAVESLRSAGIETTVFDGVVENPTTREVEFGVRVARDLGIDFLVGLGGGSSMDCAKGVNFVLTNGGTMHDYWGVGKAARPMLPFIAIPTTAGTGSEAQSFALITDPDTHQKMACGDKKVLARVAILDPDLLATVPRGVAAATGIDAVAHAIETAACRKRTEVSRALSREAWRLLDAAFEFVIAAAVLNGGDAVTAPSGANVRAATVRERSPFDGGAASGVHDADSNPTHRIKSNPADPYRAESSDNSCDFPHTPHPAARGSDFAAARADMLLGSHLAGAAIEASMLGAAHSCANPLTARFDVVHGIAVGLMLPHVIRFNAAGDNPYADLCGTGEGSESRGTGEGRESCGTGFQPVTRVAGLQPAAAALRPYPDAASLARRVEALLDAARLPRRLKDLNIPRDALPALADEAARQWTAQFNPREVDAAALLDIYRMAHQ